jgi:hypothetical protein
MTFILGGAKQNRTADLYNAIVALYQLSYDPKELNYIIQLFKSRTKFIDFDQLSCHFLNITFY